MKTKLLLLISLFINMNITSYSQEKVTAYVNGRFYTVNPKQPYAGAVVARGGRIIFTGTAEDAKKYYDNTAEIIDLRGKFVVPGFIDNHVHFMSGGFYLLGINLRPAKSTSEFKSILKEYVKGREGRWITGGDWDHEAWEIKELPRKEWIDEFTLNTPVFVNRFDGHMGLANSLALKLAGITKDTPDPDGGMIVRDPQTGEPTGMLKDNAMSLVYRIVPEASTGEYQEALRAALNEAKKNGFTSVQDITNPADLKTYQEFERQGKLSCRIDCRLPISQCESLIGLGIENNLGSDRLKIGALKAFADGSLGSSTALFFEPYAQDNTTSGLAMDIVTDGRLRKWSLTADKAHLQLSVHAIGDKANSLVLDVFEEAAKQNPAWDRRFRIEHAQHVQPGDIKRFASLGVIASVQPYHLIDDGVWAEKRIGKERLKDTYPFRSFLDSGVNLCFGSDWSVAPLDAILGIYAAVTRRTLDDKHPGGWIPEQKVTVEEAIRCYTINNAYASFEEKIKGSLEPGKLADMTVLSDNLLEIAPEKIRDVKVEMTIFNGEVIYKK